MVPARAGMSQGQKKCTAPVRVVPARAGMSPAPSTKQNIHQSGPRASGDEPATVFETLNNVEWSPRERG